MSNAASSAVCGAVLESNVDVLRDYHFARNIWLSGLPCRVVNTFFSLNLKVWNLLNLGRVKIICWLSWKNRDDFIFENQHG